MTDIHRLIIDSDFLCFEAACLGEERSINVIHKQSGREKSFPTRTEFWGHWAKKSGGWLGEQNKERIEKGLEPFSPDDFEIVDVQTPHPFSHVVNCLNTRMGSIKAKLQCDNVSHYVSGGPSWRIDRSTLIKYKGNRDDGIKPIHLKEAREYVVKKLGGEYVKDTVENYEGFLEVDDKVVVEWWNDKKAGKNSVVAGVDKDLLATGVLVFNPDKMDTYMDTVGIGRLYIDDKKDVRGSGRKWLYYQCGYGDKSDGYYANCATDTRWGEKSAFQAFEGCHTDKECLEALVGIYKKLYPKPFKFTGWRGEEIDIDWMYVLQENWDMCRMLRWENDFVSIKDVLDKMGVNYD